MRDVFEQFVVEDGDLRADLLVQPAINYALVHNRVPLVRHLSVRNKTDGAVAGVQVTLELTGPDGPLAEPWTRSVAAPIQPGGTTRWEEFADFRPDQARLRGTDEAFPVEYRLTVTRPGGRVLRGTAPSCVLAHNEWFNSPALYDSLAAFVQPNSQAVQEILREAARILQAATGSGLLDGYQAGPKRAAQIAGATYEALRRFGLTWQELPTSFANTGQKIRTTAAVLTDRLGTCLDLSVTYAACLEAAGLRPLIWLTTDRAFAGFMLEAERLKATSVTEANLLISMVESGRAVPVELSGPGSGPEAEPAVVDFPAAVQAGLAHFRTHDHRLQGVIDVRLAHRSGIRPIPDAPQTVAQAGWIPGDGAVGSIELPPGVARTRLRKRVEEDGDLTQRSDDAPPRIQQWRRSLLDLSLRNPLLDLPKRGRDLDLHVPVGALSLLEDLIHDGRPLEIVPQDAISRIHRLAGARRASDLEPDILIRELRADRRIYGAVTEQRYKSVMRTLQRDARTMEQETGSNYLYLTIGTLVYAKAGGGEAHAPLFLLPVRIEGGTGHRPYHLVIDGTEVATANHCLIEWLRLRHGVEIPELENPARDDHGVDIPKTLAAINARLLDNRLNYRVDETASLRLLRFSTFQMWRDLVDHWRLFLENPVVRHLVESSGATFDDPVGTDDALIDEAELHLPIPADGSQMKAILMAERGQSFVLEGPPGTGKSQTITNLIARAIVAGRSVLFVAEKQAALDVVKRRLRQIGLAPFTLDLHGRKQSMRAIREQLRDALDQQDPGEDPTWTAIETAYRARLEPLRTYPERVHGRNALGLSAWSAYETLRAYGEGPTARVGPHYLGAPDEQRQRVELTLREFPAAARSARLRPAHPWSLSGRRHLEGLHPDAVTQLAAELEQVRRELSDLPELAALMRGLTDPDEAARLLPVAVLAAQGRLPDRAAVEQAADPRWPQAVAQLRTELARFRQTYAAELELFRPEVLTAPELDLWLTQAQEASRRFFGRGRHLRAVATRLLPYLRPGVAELREDLVPPVLARLAAARDQARELHWQAQRIPGLPLSPAWRPTDPAAEEEFAEAERAVAAGRDLLAAYPAGWSLFEAGVSPAQLAVLDRFVSGWRAWRGVLDSGPDELRLWTGGAHWYDAWQRDGATWHSDLSTNGLLPLQRWATVLAHADVLRDGGLPEYRDQLLRAEIAPNLAEEAYRRGVAAASLAERLRAGALEYFDPEIHDNHVGEYELAAERLRSALPGRLPAVLVRRRPFHPGERRGRFADFAAELRRRRGGKSFRELFEAYADIILALTPCVMVSPASAANFLAPGAARFDLVVFDEASQIRVAEAIGAMGRGRSTVIVGDSRQMPPTTMMQASHSGDDDLPVDDGPVPEDLESILSEAVESGLPQHWLSWHYRSRDESLIAFSNRYYYDGKLSSLPSPGSGGSAGISWRRVAGRFDRGGTRTNPVEARAVVDEIVRRLSDPATADQSLGVVTFNVQQRDLILNLLEESNHPLVRDRLAADAADPIFVKNLENVQGDERDVVLFSLAFSTDPRTGQLPLTFGPLSQAGGERRLNVAITRARREVILFASFDPGDIDISRTSAVGTHHLRAYCELAEAGIDRLGDLAVDGAGHRDRVIDEVAEAIRLRGYEVKIGHGLSDFTVDIAVRAAGAARWQVAVMVDGPQWSRRPTVADRDGAPGLLRTIMGWPEVVRFWLPAWIQDRSAVLDRVEAAVARAVAATRTATADPRTAPPVRDAIAPVVFEPYVPNVVGTRQDVAAIRSSAQARETVRAALAEVLAAEAPVELHRLARLTLARFGFVKPPKGRREEVLALLDQRLIRHHPTVGSFAWPEGVDPDGWRGLRTGPEDGGARSFAEIPPEEMANAAVYALNLAPALDEEALLKSARELLGYRRRTEQNDRLLRYGLQMAVSGGRIVRRADGRYEAT
ncbi:MAG TPA: DUF4011 domain-containing protein [Micromonosporaceae bacterium]